MKKAERIVEVSAYEEVNHPPHYTFGQFEVIDVIEDWQLDFHLGNAVKYIAKAGRKKGETPLVTLQKAAWYLNRKIQLIEGIDDPIATDEEIAAVGRKTKRGSNG